MVKNGTTPIIKNKNSVRKSASKSDGNGLKIIPLGGLHEIGKNTCVFEYDDEIILLDAGLAFPTDGMHGVNIVLPDVTYLRENRHKIKGMIVTHGHEDHIGGIAFHLKQFDIPVIYGPRLAMALLQGKLEEAGVSDRTELRTVRPRKSLGWAKVSSSNISATPTRSPIALPLRSTPRSVWLFTRATLKSITPRWMENSSIFNDWQSTAKKAFTAC